MTYWRMQLHPMEPGAALRHTVTCLAAKFIGLDFGEGYPGPTRRGDDVGDLLRADPAALPETQRGLVAFATEMQEGDYVLVMVHNFPFALCRVAGGYNYVREVPPELKVWFHHFRRVDDVRYYGDFVTDAHAWERIPTPHTISPVRDEDGPVFQLIQRWVGAAQRVGVDEASARDGASPVNASVGTDEEPDVVIDVHSALQALALRRPVFHSEADFQHSLAWTLHELFPKSALRLERPVATSRGVLHVDLVLTLTDGVFVFELKYKTWGLKCLVGGEQYDLQTHGAEPIGRYDFLADVARLEAAREVLSATSSWAILLTNDSGYWSPGGSAPGSPPPSASHLADVAPGCYSGALRRLRALCEVGKSQSA